MAYMNQERKAKIAAALKAVMPKGWKYTLSVQNHSSITMTIKEAPHDLVGMLNAKRKKEAEFSGNEFYAIKNCCNLNQYYLDKELDDKAVLEVLEAAKKALYSADYYDDSDIQTDYFNCAYYVHMAVGTYDKPFKQV